MSPQDAVRLVRRMAATWPHATIDADRWVAALLPLDMDRTEHALGTMRNRPALPTISELLVAVERTAPPDLETARRGIDRCRSALEAAVQRRGRP